MAEAAETEKRKVGWPKGKPRGGTLAPTSQVVRPIAQEDVRLGAAALTEALAEAGEHHRQARYLRHRRENLSAGGDDLATSAAQP
jgi:hypothetical protein